MVDIELHNEYNSSGKSIEYLFERREEGLLVPLYQREYTWEEDNIDQLFDDLVLGLRELSENKNATTFLGTTILIVDQEKKQTTNLIDERARPTRVQIIIDGQQRISTLALLSIQITVKLKQLLKGLPDSTPYSYLHEASKKIMERLENLHTLNLGKNANPPMKPKIIWARDDSWTYDGDDSNYSSPISHYLAIFIRTQNTDAALDALDPKIGKRVCDNVKLINKWLDEICNAHIPDSIVYDQFPTGDKITSPSFQKYVFESKSKNLRHILEKYESDKNQIDYSTIAIYHILLLAYYLLNRCGVNLLQPAHRKWGFSMFQSLNATGTPLTIMETFLPQVMQAEENAENVWNTTPSRRSMDEIQNLLKTTTTNKQKNKLTDDLFRNFALCYEGKGLGNKFSDQRRWITHIYEKQLSRIEEKRDFVHKLAQIANFFYFGWYMDKESVPYFINGLNDYADGDLASLLVRFLRDAHSDLSIPILARFYSQAVHQETTFKEFIECTKACAAFFTLWRSAKSTSGLPNVYRKYFNGSKLPVMVDEHNWKRHSKPVTVKKLKQYFLDILEENRIAEEKSWTAASEHLLLYTEQKAICRFILFIAGHNRVADNANPGLTDTGRKGSCTLLTLERWMAENHRSIEHIAPQNPGDGRRWDPDIYTKGLVHHVGNLMLLPIEVNNFLDRKDWAVKYLHYCHLGVASQKKLNELRQKAERKGIVLSKKAADTLSKAGYSRTLEPILKVGESGTWDAKLIEDRTRQIKEIAWEKLISWLTS